MAALRARHRRTRRLRRARNCGRDHRGRSVRRRVGRLRSHLMMHRRRVHHGLWGCVRHTLHGLHSVRGRLRRERLRCCITRKLRAATEAELVVVLIVLRALGTGDQETLPSSCSGPSVSPPRSRGALRSLSLVAGRFTGRVSCTRSTWVKLRKNEAMSLLYDPGYPRFSVPGLFWRYFAAWVHFGRARRSARGAMWAGRVLSADCRLDESSAVSSIPSDPPFVAPSITFGAFW